LIPGTTQQNGLVAESDFSYEAPDNTPEFDLGAAEKSFLSQFTEGDFEGEEPAEVEAEPEVEAASEVEAAAPEDEEDEVDDPRLARGIQRTVARELAAKAEREAADRSIAQMKALKAELEQFKDLKPTKDIAEMMGIDTIGAIKALGHDPDTVIKLALAQQLGDKAPDNLKQFAREAATKREIAQLRSQLAQEAQARAAQEYFNTVQAGAREYVTKVGDSTPTLALVAKADPEYAHNEIMEEIVSEAKRQAAQDPNGEPISYDEAAKRVEARFSRLAKLINVQNGTNPATKNVTKPKLAPPTPKPAPKPLAPWLAKQSSDEAGIHEALRAYEQAEAQRKARRL
jgi:hypothetical protein